MKCKIFGLLSILLIAFTTEALSQKENKEVILMFSAGYQKPDISKLNDLLTQNNYSNIPDGFISGDISLYFKSGKKMYSFELSNCDQWEREENDNGIQSYFHSKGYNFSFGYKIFDKDYLEIYPIVGFVINTARLEISKPIEPDSDFQELMKTVDNQNSYIISNNSISAGFQTFTYINDLVFGLKTGYYSPFSKTDNWRIHSNTQLSNGVQINPGGFYIRGSIGFRFNL
ncbi:hypothetical protein [Carboxylicivirga sp. N1Y90]|uniref:hypothetical protein n=1 Tax=Carboxylicivirga fragile TaxID=3417571 RepID=UPI003D34A98A|nr:hypothetical protein [Marinilabiliaceae bacterium N1Y90]